MQSVTQFVCIKDGRVSSFHTISRYSLIVCLRLALWSSFCTKGKNIFQNGKICRKLFYKIVNVSSFCVLCKVVLTHHGLFNAQAIILLGLIGLALAAENKAVEAEAGNDLKTASSHGMKYSYIKIFYLVFKVLWSASNISFLYTIGWGWGGWGGWGWGGHGHGYGKFKSFSLC